MEKLSRINFSLVTQLREMERHHVTLKTLLTLKCDEAGELVLTPLEDILNATRLYLQVLSQMGNRSPYSVAFSSSMPEVAQTYQRYASSLSSPSVSRDDSTRSLEASSVFSGIDLFKTQHECSTQLLVLICYVHILKVHVALFAHIQRYLENIAETEERILNPLPRLFGFDNIPLRKLHILPLREVTDSKNKNRIRQPSGFYGYPSCHKHVRTD